MYHNIAEVEDEIFELLTGYQHAAIGTHNGTYADVTKVTPVLFPDGHVYMLLSDLSQHTRNIKETNGQGISLYFAGPHRHTTEMNNKRLTMYGSVSVVEATADEYNDMLLEFDKRDAGATMFGKFADFNVYRFETVDRLYIKGFGKAYK